MATSISDQERIQRERDFHNARFGGGARRSSRFYTVAGDATAAYQDRVRALAGPGTRVIEYGCGTGSLAPVLAEAGADVLGIDISEVAVEVARGAAEGTTGSGRARFEVMDAEHLALDDDSVDLVCGSGILHHLDLDRAVRELARVLGDDGRAVFFEPLGHNPAVNAYRRLTPDERTEDEHPLLDGDLRGLFEHFREVRAQGFELLALAALPIRRATPVVGALHQLDRALFRRWPRTQRWAWIVVVELAGPRPRGG